MVEIAEAATSTTCWTRFVPGAIGYVSDGLDGERRAPIVRAAAAREAIVPSAMVLELLLELRGNGAGAGALTMREAQVLGMLRRGRSTASLGERLEIAPVIALDQGVALDQRASLTEELLLFVDDEVWLSADVAATARAPRSAAPRQPTLSGAPHVSRNKPGRRRNCYGCYGRLSFELNLKRYGGAL